MTTNHHTPIATGAARTHTVVNTPLSALDTSLTNYANTPVSARFSRTTLGQTISNNSLTVIDFNNEETDSHNAVTTGAGWLFTVPTAQAGLYLVEASVYFSSIADSWSAGEFAYLSVAKNGSLFKYLDFVETMDTVPASLFFGLHGQTILNLAVSDTVAFEVKQISGEDQTVLGLGVATYCSITRLGDSA